jgi:hypothetical protein
MDLCTAGNWQLQRCCLNTARICLGFCLVAHGARVASWPLGVGVGADRLEIGAQLPSSELRLGTVGSTHSRKLCQHPLPSTDAERQYDRQKLIGIAVVTEVGYKTESPLQIIR